MVWPGPAGLAGDKARAEAMIWGRVVGDDGESLVTQARVEAGRQVLELLVGDDDRGRGEPVAKVKEEEKLFIDPGCRLFGPQGDETVFF